MWSPLPGWPPPLPLPCCPWVRPPRRGLCRAPGGIWTFQNCGFSLMIHGRLMDDDDLLSFMRFEWIYGNKFTGDFWNYRNFYFCWNRRFLELAAAISMVPAAVWLLGLVQVETLLGLVLVNVGLVTECCYFVKLGLVLGLVQIKFCQGCCRVCFCMVEGILIACC